MEYTTRMVRLLEALRRERNGAVADAMRFQGRPCGLNYGVSLPTVRALARAEGCDHGFARYLYEQDVRELKLAACTVADPAALDSAEAEFWGAGAVNSELAEELAFALLSRSPELDTICGSWVSGSSSLRRYTALMAAARAPRPRPEWLAAAVAAVGRNPGERLTLWAIEALAEHLVRSGAATRDEIVAQFGKLGASPVAEALREEVSWRLDY